MDIEVEGLNLTLPEGFCDDYSILLDIVSPDTWNNHLSDENRESLMKFLPDFPENDLEEKTTTLEQFFMQENFKFGTPIESFYNKLLLGEFNPAIRKMKRMHKKLQYKQYKLRQKEFYHDLLEDVLVSRQYHLEKFSCNNNLVDKIPERIGYAKEDIISMRVRRRYLNELKQIRLEAGFDSDLSDDDISSEGINFLLNKKQRRQLLMMEASYPADLVPVRGTFSQGSLPLDLELGLAPSRNPFDCSDEQYKNLLMSHFTSKKSKKSVSLDTRGITMQSVMKRSDILPMKRPQVRLETNGFISSGFKSQIPSRRDNNKRHQLKGVHQIKLERNGSVIEDTSSLDGGIGCSSESDNGDTKSVIPTKKRRRPSQNLKKRKRERNKKLTEDSSQDFVRIKEENIKVEDTNEPADINCNVSLSAELTQETHISFFSLLRDVICSTPMQRMSKAQLEATVKSWQDSAISPLNEWFSICSSWHYVLPAAINFLCGNVPNDFYASDFVPYIEYKLNGKYYQWIGAGRDSDANLEGLCQYWLLNRDQMGNDWLTNLGVGSLDNEEVKVLPSPRSTTTFTVRPPSDADKQAYHVQETKRYERPHKAFTFRLHGYESVIGPVKGIYTEQSGTTSKARGHSLLIDDRFPYVTILSLVRDAVARLPNGEGTKADICELLRESRYIVQMQGPNHDSTLNSVASGALDRLQYGEDPCVKFDTSRKLWIYLHRDRTEEEFERLHHLNGPMGGKAKHHGSSRKSSKMKKDDFHAPPNISMDSLASSIRQSEGNEVKLKADDMIENWGKISTDKCKIAKQSDKSTIKAIKIDVKESSQDIIGSRNIVAANSSTKMYQKSEVIPDAKDLLRPQNSSCGILPATKSNTNLGSSSLPIVAIQSKNSTVIGKRKLLRPMGMTIAKSNTSSAESVQTTIREALDKVSGIKVLQYPNISTSQGKAVISGSPIVVQAGSSAIQNISGQKVVLPSNRVLLQGGKLLHTVPSSGILAGNKVLTGVFPQQLMALGGVKSSCDQAVEGSLSGGRFVQIATVDSAHGSSGNFQKVALLPQLAQLRSSVSSKGQISQQTTSNRNNGTEVRLKLASGSSQLAAGSLISLGGKQIFLTPKGSSAFASSHLQQIIVAADGNSGEVSGDAMKTVSVGQPIVLPATAVQGAHINLKRLQTYQSFKVISASQLPVQQKGKPIAALVTTSSPQASNTTKTSFPIKPNIEFNEKK